MLGFGRGKADPEEKARDNFRSLVFSSTSYLSGFALSLEWIAENYPGTVNAADAAWERGDSVKKAAVFVLIAILTDQCKQLRDLNPAKADAVIASIGAGYVKGDLFQSPLENAILSAFATAEIWGKDNLKIGETDADLILSECVGALAGQDDAERIRRRVRKILDSGKAEPEMQ